MIPLSVIKKKKAAGISDSLFLFYFVLEVLTTSATDTPRPQGTIEQVLRELP